MSPFQFLKQLSTIPKPGGDGVRVSKNYSPTDLKTAAGLTLTAATAPTIANVETSAIAIVAAASSTALGSLVFVVPEDYDETANELKIVGLIESGGTTDFPVFDAQVFRKRAGAALSADLAPTATAAIVAAAAERTITIANGSTNPLLAGDVLTINLFSGAHTTDSVILHGVSVQWKSSIVFNDPSNR